MAMNIIPKVFKLIELPSSYCFPGLDYISESLHYVAKLQLQLKQSTLHLDIWLLEMLILQLEFLKEYTVGRIIGETTQVIWKCLVKKVYMNAPRSECEWREISAEFKKHWNFPHCIGAIDRMHFIFILCI